MHDIIDPKIKIKINAFLYSSLIFCLSSWHSLTNRIIETSNPNLEIIENILIDELANINTPSEYAPSSLDIFNVIKKPKTRPKNWKKTTWELW